MVCRFAAIKKKGVTRILIIHTVRSAKLEFHIQWSVVYMCCILDMCNTKKISAFFFFTK